MGQFMNADQSYVFMLRTANNVMNTSGVRQGSVMESQMDTLHRSTSWEFMSLTKPTESIVLEDSILGIV